MLRPTLVSLSLVVHEDAPARLYRVLSRNHRHRRIDGGWDEGRVSYQCLKSGDTFDRYASEFDQVMRPAALGELESAALLSQSALEALTAHLSHLARRFVAKADA